MKIIYSSLFGHKLNSSCEFFFEEVHATWSMGKSPTHDFHLLLIYLFRTSRSRWTFWIVDSHLRTRCSSYHLFSRYTHMYICMCRRTCMCIYLYMCLCPFMCVCLYVHVQCICKHTQYERITFIHVCEYVRVHSYMNVRTFLYVCFDWWCITVNFLFVKEGLIEIVTYIQHSQMLHYLAFFLFSLCLCKEKQNNKIF